MSVHDQLAGAVHEEPIRATVRNAQFPASRPPRLTASLPEADTALPPGWSTHAPEMWVRSRHALVPIGAPDESTSPPAAASSAPEWQLCRELHDGLGPTLAGLALGLGTAQALSVGQPDLHGLLVRLEVETHRAVADLRRI